MKARALIGTAAVLLALTNVAVLGGAAYNRLGTPESTLLLSERELGPQWSWGLQTEENSELLLQLLFRTERIPAGEGPDGEGPLYPLATRAAPWLDRAKLKQLGFDVEAQPGSEEGAARYRRMQGRDLVLVLELEGPAHARALAAARDHAAKLAAAAAANAADGELENRAQLAQDRLRREEQEDSRLFVVDAGHDAAALRQQYPDRTRYALVRGRVVPVVVGEAASAKLYGMVTEVFCDSINVARQFRSAIPFGPGDNVMVLPAKRSPFQVSMAFGKRLEPWIVAAHGGAPTSE